MQALTMKQIFRQPISTVVQPATGRGRALYTTDWFCHGKPILSNHDNPRLLLRNGLVCD